MNLLLKRASSIAAVTILCASTACTSGETSTERADVTAERGRFREPAAVPEPAFAKAGPDWFDRACAMPLEYLLRIRRGYRPDRGSDVTFVSRLPHNFGSLVSARHTGPFEFLQRVPLVLYGPGHVRARGRISLEREVTVADIAPTVAELIGASFQEDRPGRVIEEALLPAEQRTSPPRLVVTIVWDGGGWNTLRTWPEKWPFLRDLMKRGTVVSNATVGSSPSVTMPVHATIGTGVFPNQHGIVTDPIRVAGRMRKSYGHDSPKYLETTTLADEFDLQTQNEAKVALVAARNWHLGLIGHGAGIEGGDHDIAVLIDLTARKRFFTNRGFYDLPSYVGDITGLARDTTSIDVIDGEHDGRWMGHSLGPKELFKTPVWDLFQTRVIKSVIAREGFGDDGVPDLVYTNYKQIDHLGHIYNMLAREIGASVRTSDLGLRSLAGFLDSTVGRRNWVLVLTADHGQAPHPTVIDGWPISLEGIRKSVEKHFDAEGLIQSSKPDGLWLDPEVMASSGVDELDVVEFLLDYRVKDNVIPGREVLRQFRDDFQEKLLAAVFPSKQVGRVWRCARRRAQER